ncbi:MAG: arginine--tRNA ligase, partial [Pseudonocardiales bacterium]|nr:arginine--tRNA ligase [Pseudonocardiales bacterium]
MDTTLNPFMASRVCLLSRKTGQAGPTKMGGVTPQELSDAIRAAVESAAAAGELPGADDPAVLAVAIVVERPRNRDHGDYTTNVAMRLAKPVGRAPRDIAAIIAERLRQAEGIADVDIAGPGFLNVRLSAGTLGGLAGTIVRAGAQYGHSQALAGQRINLEFVSANPTGPVHLAHARWAAVGDSLHRILVAAGADVTAEHYINDAGSQLEKFGRSLYAAAVGEPIPEDGYHGAYIPELAAQLLSIDPDLTVGDRADNINSFRKRGYLAMLAEIRASLETFRVHFDVWFSELSLHESGAIDKALDTLRQQGHVYEADGAVWLRTTDFGDDKDRPLIKSDGDTTYFAADCAYYLDKRGRGFDRAVLMLGPDHHGYVGRMKAMVACAGDDPDQNIEILIGQVVKLLRGGEELKLSKRAGTIVTLDELIELVGVDAARYTLARWSTDTPVTIDVEEVTKNSNENPVHYVQYAHARLSSLQRNAAELGIVRSDEPDL